MFQADWRWCKKCEGLFFAYSSRRGVCPSGDTHEIGGGQYFLALEEPTFRGQSNWRWCSKCEGLFFAENGRLGKCPAGGTHTIGGGNYSLTLDDPGFLGQRSWRWCEVCEGLYFADGERRGKCPSGKSHLLTGGEYTLSLDAPPKHERDEEAKSEPWCARLYLYTLGGGLQEIKETRNSEKEAWEFISSTTSHLQFQGFRIESSRSSVTHGKCT
jgi:hypothetical protein